MTDNTIAIGADGLYHPANEAEVIALIQYAQANNKQVRGRGATHSVAWSIYTDPEGNTPPNRTLEQHPPQDGQINIAFDKMRALDWIDETAGIIEAEPGINLGWDPEDPFGVSTLENSFLHQIFEKGWAVNTLGGITHQTLAGFTASGSAGGSTRYAWDNAVAFRMVDGLGNAAWIEKGSAEFDAVSTSMGLMGVITKMRLQLVPMYNVAGTEKMTPVTGPEAPMDLFGDGSASQPSLEQHLKDRPYTRTVWWPQKGAERIQTWEAKRVPASDKNLVPYQQFTPNFTGQTMQLAAATFFVLLGNNSVSRIMGFLGSKVSHYFTVLGPVMKRGGSGFFARLLAYVAAVFVSAIVLLLGLVLSIFKGSARALFPKLLPAFSPMTKPGQETRFNDYYWRSLCMDNTVDDIYLGTEFTEIWVPIGHAKQAINLYREMFETRGPEATGYFSTEVYGGPPSAAWLDPGYTDGSDEYRDGTVRFDLYWYRNNRDVPNADEGFFEQYWDVLKDAGVPFRLHWGKFVPRYDFPQWAAHYRASLPRFDDFMALREKRDPHGLFFTKYWRDRLTGGA
ncbi:MAG: hypothetical protein ABJ242_05945 [Marinomonas sp.]